MKGRGNYLCLHRFDTFRDNPLSMAFVEPEVVEALSAWAGRTDTGDRAELEDLPEDLGIWREIAATSENCVGSSCPRYQDCFVTRMRQRAAESDLVVVNHHLLCADASVRQDAYGEVIPECHVAIIDEAHQLEDVATQYFGVSVSTYRVEELVRDAERLLRMGAAKADAQDVRRAVNRVQDRGARFFEALLAVRAGGRPGTGDDRTRVSPDTLADAAAPGTSFAEALDALQGVIVLGRELAEDVQALGRRAGEMRDQLKFLLRAADPDYVYYLEARGRGVFLRASPIDVSSIVREVLLERMQSTVLTSATLSVGGVVRLRAGAAGGPGRRRNCACLPSSTTRRRRSSTCRRGCPTRARRRSASAAGREVVEILRRTEGRAFVLFTSYAVLREVEAGG